MYIYCPYILFELYKITYLRFYMISYTGSEEEIFQHGRRYERKD